MVHGYKKKNDQIASSSGKGGIENSKRFFAKIFTSLFSKTIYAVPIVRHSGSETVFKNRLSRHNTIADRFFRFTQSLRIREYSALFDTLLCRKKATKKRAFEILLASIFKLAREIGLIDEKSEAAIDSTGLETHHISRHFVACTKRPSYFRRTWPKVTIVCDTFTHLIASCIVTRGPGYDFPLFEKALCNVTKEVEFDRILADAGYDSEKNHLLGREVFGMETIIALNLKDFCKMSEIQTERQE